MNAAAKLTDAELVILSLLVEHPMHGYQVEQTIEQRNMRTWTDLSTSSIYYILRQLEEKGYICEKLFLSKMSEEHRGRGKPRKVFEATESGRGIWKSETLRSLSKPRITYTNFLMGLHNLWNIDPQEACQSVRVYRDWLQGDLTRQRNELANFGTPFFPLDVLFEYGFAVGDAELGFLDKLIDRLEKRSKEQKGN